MVRLYNHTRYQDDVLRDVLNFAARCAGVVGDVPAKLTYCLYLRGGGLAHRSYPYRKTLIGKPTTSSDRRCLKCPIGWIEVHLPKVLMPFGVMVPTPDVDALALTAAEWFVDVCIHEMAHVRQFRNKQFTTPGNFHLGGLKRRPKHDSRPCEIDAENAVFDVHENRPRNKRRQELVLRLAIMLIDNQTETSVR